MMVLDKAILLELRKVKSKKKRRAFVVIIDTKNEIYQYTKVFSMIRKNKKRSAKNCAKLRRYEIVCGRQRKITYCEEATESDMEFNAEKDNTEPGMKENAEQDMEMQVDPVPESLGTKYKDECGTKKVKKRKHKRNNTTTDITLNQSSNNSAHKKKRNKALCNKSLTFSEFSEAEKETLEMNRASAKINRHCEESFTEAGCLKRKKNKMYLLETVDNLLVESEQTEYKIDATSSLFDQNISDHGKDSRSVKKRKKSKIRKSCNIDSVDITESLECVGDSKIATPHESGKRAQSCSPISENLSLPAKNSFTIPLEKTSFQAGVFKTVKSTSTCYVGTSNSKKGNVPNYVQFFPAFPQNRVDDKMPLTSRRESSSEVSSTSDITFMRHTKKSHSFSNSGKVKKVRFRDSVINSKKSSVGNKETVYEGASSMISSSDTSDSDELSDCDSIITLDRPIPAKNNTSLVHAAYQNSMPFDSKKCESFLEELDCTNVPINFDVPFLHQFDRTTITSKGKKAELIQQGVLIRTGKWTDEETEILKCNFEDFVKRFHIRQPALLLETSLRANPLKQLQAFLRATRFYVRLARGLCDRPLDRVLQKARDVFLPKRPKKKIGSGLINVSMCNNVEAVDTKMQSSGFCTEEDEDSAE